MGCPAPSSTAPLVSAIVLSYNNARYVEETLESIRAQTYAALELVVVDDASSDDSVRRIRAWQLARGYPLTLLENPVNRGVCRALNRALEVSQGAFVAAVASDDLWYPEKLGRQVALLRDAGDGVGMVYSDADRIDEQGSACPGRFIEQWRPDGRPADEAVFEALEEGNFVPAPATLVRRSCYQRLGPYDETLAYEDWDMWLRIAHAYRVAYSDYVAAAYRVVTGSLTQRLFRQSNPAAVETAARIARKWVRARSLGDASRRRWAGRLADAARELFRVRHASAPLILRWAILYGPPSERAPLARALARCLWARSRGRFTPLPS